MIGGVFIYNDTGDILIHRLFRDEIDHIAIDEFRAHIIQARTAVRSPINRIAHSTYMHVQRCDIWLCAVSKGNCNVAAALSFLYCMLNVMEQYFGKVNENNVRQNFVLIYELLDEFLDYGYPQTTDAAVLKTYITQQGVRTGTQEETSLITSQLTGQIGWRVEGIRYRSNELCLDIVESVSVSMSPQGNVLSCHCDGRIRMSSCMSGMPECQFAFNNILIPGEGSKAILDESKNSQKKASDKDGSDYSVAVEDCQFHQCVKLSKSDNKHTFSFIPPDGEFELMRYRTTKQITVPFRIIPLISEKESHGMEIKVVVKSDFSPTFIAQKVQVRIPIPNIADDVAIVCVKGKAKYKPSENAVIWRIKSLAGMRESQLTIDVQLMKSAVKQKRWSRPPISMQFEIPFTPSGFKARFLKVFESKLNYSDQDVIKWVRYSGNSGTYEARC